MHILANKNNKKKKSRARAHKAAALSHLKRLGSHTFVALSAHWWPRQTEDGALREQHEPAPTSLVGLNRKVGQQGESHIMGTALPHPTNSARIQALANILI